MLYRMETKTMHTYQLQAIRLNQAKHIQRLNIMLELVASKLHSSQFKPLQKPK